MESCLLLFQKIIIISRFAFIIYNHGLMLACRNGLIRSKILSLNNIWVVHPCDIEQDILYIYQKYFIFQLPSSHSIQTCSVPWLSELSRVNPIILTNCYLYKIQETEIFRKLYTFVSDQDNAFTTQSVLFLEN